MSDKSILIKTFNTHFVEFLDDIIRTIPDNMDLKTAKTSSNMIILANPSMIIKAWYKFIYTPYSKQIEAGDITFFFEKDYSNDLVYISNSNEIMQTIDILREPIKNMNDAEKEFTTKYLQNLTKLSVLYTTYIQ